MTGFEPAPGVLEAPLYGFEDRCATVTPHPYISYFFCSLLLWVCFECSCGDKVLNLCYSRTRLNYNSRFNISPYHLISLFHIAPKHQIENHESFYFNLSAYLCFRDGHGAMLLNAHVHDDIHFDFDQYILYYLID